MTWLSENPWPLGGAFLVLAAALLIALRVTQQGKYLVASGAALGLAGVVVLIDWLWVTDRERIGRVVHEVADAFEDNDYDRIVPHLDPSMTGGFFNRMAIRGALMAYDFEFVHIRRMEIDASDVTGMGKADFYAMAQWEVLSEASGVNFDATPPPGLGLSVGFRQVEPGVWKIARVDVTAAPGGAGSREVVERRLDRLSRMAEGR